MQKVWTVIMIPTVESTKGFKSIIQNVKVFTLTKKISSLFIGGRWHPCVLAYLICVSILYMC